LTDRIANPWGERTPFGRDEEWPLRVDRFLDEGVNEEDVDAWVQTASILHSNGDAMDIAVKDGRIVAEGPPGELGRERDRYKVAYDSEGRRVELETDDPTELLHRLTRDALARGERLEGLAVARPTLEEVYLQLTAEDERPG